MNNKQSLLSMLEAYMTVDNPKADFSQYVKYREAMQKAKQLVDLDKFSSCEVTDPKEKLNWHTVKAEINADTDFDGEEVKLLADFIACFDYVVFEEGKEGKTKLNLSVDNMYI